MLKKCSICNKDYPIPTLKPMVHIIERKAYVKRICPNCQAIVLNNPNYYYLVVERQSGA